MVHWAFSEFIANSVTSNLDGCTLSWLGKYTWEFSVGLSERMNLMT